MLRKTEYFEKWKKSDDYVVFKHNCLNCMDGEELFNSVAGYAFETGFDEGVTHWDGTFMGNPM